MCSNLSTYDTKDQREVQESQGVTRTLFSFPEIVVLETNDREGCKVGLIHRRQEPV